MDLLATLPLPFVPVAVVTAAALICHVVTTLYLMQVLNRIFDPDWVPQMLYPPVGPGQRYKWTLYYSGAVWLKSVRDLVFENKPYDFSGRLSRTTRAVCLMHHLFAALALLGLLALAGYALFELWHWWQDLPSPEPPKPAPPPDDLLLPP